jgi:hypothetical protein
MKKCWVILLAAAFAAPGCMGLPPILEPSKPAAPPEKEAPLVAQPKRPTMLVTPEQVNEGNAREMSKALWEELDRDSQTGSDRP